VDSTAPTPPCEIRRSRHDETIPFVKVPVAKVEVPGKAGLPGKVKEIARRNRAKGRGTLEGLVVDGRYRLSFLIGRGGMSVVYLARCLETGRHVAIKFLRPELVDRTPYRQRFMNEIEAIRRIQHPVVVRMFDIGELEDGRIYLVMEYVRGPALKKILERGHLPMEQLLPIASAVADGLEAAHAHGVIHRDLKPGNILVPRLPEAGAAAKIVDFGIARIDGFPKITNTAEVVGTPLYISPEQALGYPVDHRADIYCFGVVLYEACIGKRMFDSRDPQILLKKHVRVVPARMAERRPDLAIPRALDDLVIRCLEKSPGRRPQSMNEIGAALQAIASRVLVN
jgi:eukaryotic-like serine/threonine-protein kinase